MIDIARRWGPTVGLVALLWVGLALPAYAQPRILFETESIDLGTVRDTETVGAAFRFRNMGDAPLEVVDLNAA